MAPRFTRQFWSDAYTVRKGWKASMKPSDTPRTIFTSSMVS